MVVFNTLGALLSTLGMFIAAVLGALMTAIRWTFLLTYRLGIVLVALSIMAIGATIVASFGTVHTIGIAFRLWDVRGPFWWPVGSGLLLIGMGVALVR